MRRRDVLWGVGAVGLVGIAACQTGPSLDGGATGMEAAFFYAYPLYEIARTGQNRAAQPGLNVLGHRATLADHTMRQITAPNNDTIYTSAQLELSAGPLEINAPTDLKRYFNISFMDAFTDNFAAIGTGPTKGVGGRYWITGPGWTGVAPAGVNVIKAPTNDVWMLARIVVDGPEDLAAAKALQQQITLKPLTNAASRAFGVKCTNALDAQNFLAVVNDMLARSPGTASHLARRDAFSAFGIGLAPDAAIPPDLLAAWTAYLPSGISKLREAFEFRELIVDGWTYQQPGVGSTAATPLLRSAIALGGLAALPEAEAMYYHCLFELNGERLTGANKYVWRVPPGGVPVDAFWSLTMYAPEDDGRYFYIQNPIDRFSVGDRTKGLVKNADGSIDILIQHEAPAGPKAANWLPAPKGPIRLALRAYLPKAELRDRRWKAPPVQRA